MFEIFHGPVLKLFGASPETFGYARDYLTIYLIGTVFVMISLGMNGFINAQGFGRTGMCTVLIGAVLNIILDPVFIFVLDMGVKGAAAATVISQAMSALWVVAFLTGKRALIRLRPSCMKVSFRHLRKIMSLWPCWICNVHFHRHCADCLQRLSGDVWRRPVHRRHDCFDLYT